MSAVVLNSSSAATAPNSGDSWSPPFSPIVQLFGWFVASLLSLETILGNSMVLLAYRLERSISKQLNNRFIVSLAISDLIIGIEGIPFFTVYVINGDRWPLGPIACEIWLFLDYTLCLVSILTVLLITADRYLSVCHTASYLKWQTPLKMQLLITASWLLPALTFGVMIFGWPWIGGKEERIQATSDGECYAPFLANPFVNMGMYLAYYWTTLVAMLILYKGIHKAAKKLEKRSRAREHRHIALLLTQRLGTQVGVGLMLHAKRYHEEAKQEQCKQQKLTMRFEAKDSGYITANTLSTTDSAERRRSSFSTLAKAVQSTQRLARFRRYGATFAFRSKFIASEEKGIAKKKEQTEKENEKCVEQGTERNNSSSRRNSQKKKQTTDKKEKKGEKEEKNSVEEEEKDNALVEDIGEEEEEKNGEKGAQKDKDEFGCVDEQQFDSVAITSLSTDAFNDESLSSVLHFNPSAIVSPFVDASASDTTSQIITIRKTMGESVDEAFKIVRNASSMNSDRRRIGENGRNFEKVSANILKGCNRSRSKSSPISVPLAPKVTDETLDKEQLEERAEEHQSDKTKEEKAKMGGKGETGVPRKLEMPLTFESQQLDHQQTNAASPTALTMGKTVSQTPSRRPSEHQQQGNANGGTTEEEEGGGMLGRFFNRIHSWVRISMYGIFVIQLLFWIGIGGMDNERTGGESSGETRPDLLYGLPSFLHSSRSYSSMSSISSQDTSKRPSLLPAYGQVPRLTVTRGSIWDNAAGDGEQQTDDGEGRTEEKANTPLSAHMSFAENGADGRKPSRILHSVFAPISALHRRRKRTKAERRAHKAFRTITFIVGLFAILWSPYYVVATIYGFCRGQCIPNILYNVSYYMCYLNSSLNPFAYALANRQFRLAFARILRGNLRQL